MKTATFGFVFFSVVILTLISCKKAKMSRTNLLVEKTWRFTKWEEKTNSGAYTDYFPGLSDCEKDNILNFKIDYTYQLTEGATKCSPGDPDVIDAGIWDLEQNDSHLVVDTDDYLIEQLTESILVISGSEITGSDTLYYKYTLVH